MAFPDERQAEKRPAQSSGTEAPCPFMKVFSMKPKAASAFPVRYSAYS